MQITISLPEVPETDVTDKSNYDILKHFLRQLELSVHHAQKSLDEINKMNSELDIPEDIYLSYRVYDVDYAKEGDKEGTPARVELEFYTM